MAEYLFITIGSGAHGVAVCWPLIVLLGLFIGFLTGLFGVGGGFLLTPCLKILFGIAWGIAVGSGLLLFFFTGSVSAWRHWRRGNVDARLGVIMAAAASCGAFLGKAVLAWLEEGRYTVILLGHEHLLLDRVMDTLFGVLMAGVLISILREKPSQNGDDQFVETRIARFLHGFHLPPTLAYPRSHIETMSLWAPLMISFGVGVLTGLMGIGGGFIMFPLMVYVLGVPTLVAVGTSAFQIVFATAFGTVAHAQAGNLSLPLVAMMLVGSLLGVQLGVAASHRLGGRSIRKYFAAVLALGLAVILVNLALALAQGPGASG